MKRISLWNVLPALLLAASLSACSDENDDGWVTPPDLYELGGFTDNGVTVSAWSEAPLAVGYHKVWIGVHRNGERLEEIQIDFRPMMQMSGHSHSTPREEPTGIRDSEYGLYEAAAVFTMPSGSMGSWELQLSVREPDGGDTVIQGEIPVDVEQSGLVRSFQADDDERYVLTLVEPGDPQTGLNDLRVLLHRRESETDFPPVTGAQIVVEPWMSAMDHGSANNVDPVHDRAGHYLGSVNFNMSGDWELRFDITVDGNTLDRQIFEITF